MIPRFSTPEEYQKLFALNVTQYGQMTAGSWCYIGPQGIVHGTTLTVLNACRRIYGTSDVAGKVFLTSGLGGMSGAQAKAATICGCVGVIAEIDLSHLIKRKNQGWLDEYYSDVDELIEKIRVYKAERKGISIGYHGNVVDIWEKLVDIYNTTGEELVELGSDQTSCHDIKGGGYLPVGYTIEQGPVTKYHLKILHQVLDQIIPHLVAKPSAKLVTTLYIA